MGDFSEKTISSRKIYDGKIISIRLDKVCLPDGKESFREIVEMTNAGAVAIVPIEENEVYFVRQFRKPVEKILLEIPAGRVEPGEDPEECARRELTEEIGYCPAELEQLSFFYSSPGFSNEVLYLYLARGLVKKQVNRDEGEFMEVVSLPLPEALEKISSGEIEDGKTIIGLLMVSSYLGRGIKNISGEGIYG
ncbi:MAG: NUDIX hydrolase [Dethiobacter sp.]|jgi:ADP-ribose pyrophosphatase|nr:MAG: NUDIX hydrolase [Dethiobacter sp.]